MNSEVTTGKVFGEELARISAELADSKQAENIMVLDLRGRSVVSDFYVICTATSMPHLKAVYREVKDKLAVEHKVKVLALDGQAESHWMVLDYADVMVHVFHTDKRDVYDLEGLWNDAPVFDWK